MRSLKRIAICFIAVAVVVLGEETMAKSADLTLAKKRKKDEFYTGGKTVPENLQMLCADCNARKSDKF